MEDAVLIDEKERKIKELELKILDLEALVKYYEEQFRLAKQRQFGKSSEKTNTIEEQIGLFDEAENEADKKAKEPDIEEITYKRRKREGKREEDLSKLPVETIEYTLPIEKQVCPECGETMHAMSKEVRRELKVIPAEVYVVEHVRYIYSCRDCERNNTSVPIIKAEAPEPLIKGSLASPSAVAYIAVQKYVNAVPLYRLEQGFIRDGIALSRQTMANWLIRVSDDYLTLVYDEMHKELKKEEALHADETVLQVLNEPGKNANTNSYMWLYRTSGDTKHPIVLYEYQPTRSSSHPKKFLEGYKGYLHTDGYAGYHNLSEDIIIVGCFAHVRRKFDEALKSMPKESQNGSLSEKGLNYCNELFKLERDFIDLSFEDRYKKRLELSKPIFDDFYRWVTSVKALPKSTLGTAINYVKEQKPYLENIFLDGRLELSNNRAERSIKPFVIGRKNWLFCNTKKGANASSVIYSIIETAKENKLNPFKYMKFLLERLPNISISQISELLPWNVSLK